MKMVLVVFLMLAVLLLTWVFIVRPRVRDKASWAWFFRKIEPIELLWQKSETKLKARLMILTGALLTALTQTQSIDITPLMPFVPDKWEPYVRVAWNMLPLAISLIGMWDENLRNNTTKPIELVAVKEEAITPQVQQALAKVQEAKEIAVEKVKAAEQKVAAT